MIAFTIRNAQPGDAAALAAIQHRSLQLCPDMDPLPAVFFRNPGLQDGRNLFLAVDPSDRILAYGMLFNNGGDRRYCDIKVDPEAGVAGLDDRALRDALLSRVIERAREMKSAADLPELLLYGCYFEDGRESIGYLKSSGFQALEELTGIELRLDLREAAMPDPPAAQGVTVREWPLVTAAERARYLAAHSRGLTVSPLSEERLADMVHAKHFTAIAAFDGDAVAGAAVAFARSTEGEALLEYLFVLPEWQRRGIARQLVGAVVGRLKGRGLVTLQVETALDNQAATALYEAAGFRRARREVMLGMTL